VGDFSKGTKAIQFGNAVYKGTPNMLSFIELSEYLDQEGRNCLFEFVLSLGQILDQFSEGVGLVPLDLGQLGGNVKVTRQVAG